MQRSRSIAIAAHFDNLAEGDPLAWAFVGFFLLLAVAALLIVLKVRRDLNREDDARAKRYGRR